MTVGRTDFLRGVMDLLLLRVLADGPRHATGLTEELQGVFEGVVSVKVSSLHGRLRHLERQGWVTSGYGRSSTNRQARYYELTPEGWTQLERSADDWHRFAALVAGMMLPNRGRPEPEQRPTEP